jgi:predicted phage terminase large subunit-like protein
MAQAEGTLCWPERYPEDEMEKMKNIKGPYAWAAQYLQLPTVRGGAIIRREWWRRWTRSVWPEFGTVIASLDTAIKEGTENDFNALTILGAFADEADRAPQIMLADAWRVRTNLADLVRMVAESCRKHNVDYLLIEDKARGHDVAAEIKRLYANAPWDTLLLQIKGGRYAQDKVTRVLAVTPMFSGPVRKDTESGLDIWDGGMFWAPEAPWAEEVIAETTSFPRGAHDDYVDCLAQAALWMRRTGLAITRAEFRETEDEAMQYQRPVGVPYAIHGPADA